MPITCRADQGQAKDHEASTTPPRVLIVEDQEVIQEVLLTVFGQSGFETLCAGSVGEAMEKLKLNPGFCTLDLHLPDGRGTQVLQRIRDEGLPIKVAVTTGTIDNALLRTAADLKPERVFQKPYSAIDLVRWIVEEGNRTSPLARATPGA